MKAPTLAELVIEESELKRLIRQGMEMRERVSVPKAGVTQPILEKIHQAWRKSELVRLRFHEELAHNMKMAHQIVEVSLFGMLVNFDLGCVWMCLFTIWSGCNEYFSFSKHDFGGEFVSLIH